MMAHLVGHDVGLGKIARSAEAGFQFLVKAQIEIDFFVFGAIERPDRCPRHPAGRIHLACEQVELGIAIDLPLLFEQVAPNDLSVLQHDGHEVPQRLLLGVDLLPLLLRIALRRLLLLEHCSRIAAQQVNN